MSAMINAMLTTRPGKWMMGGPDPWTHNAFAPYPPQTPETIYQSIYIFD